MNALAELRKAKNKTQQQMADCFGVSVKTWSAWECGSRMPPASTQARMRDYFKRKIEYIFFGAYTYDK